MEAFLLRKHETGGVTRVDRVEARTLEHHRPQPTATQHSFCDRRTVAVQKDWLVQFGMNLSEAHGAGYYYAHTVPDDAR